MNNFKFKLLNFWFVLTHPSFWISNEKSSEDVDKFINTVINEDKIRVVGRFCAKLKNSNKEIWVSNYPYAFGNVIVDGRSIKGLPYALTRFRLKQYLDKKVLEDESNE